MKRYLLGFGAMLVGAGLMFVFTHTEVSAESEGNKPEPFVCSDEFEEDLHKLKQLEMPDLYIIHCETKTLDCALTSGGASCVKKGLFK